jgi:serine/threonine protein kinase
MEYPIKTKLSEIIQDDDLFFQAEIRIGPFKLLDQIGKGNFATVSLGIHEETKEKVAIKQIKKSELNNNNFLLNEINIQKYLFHPYLIKMYCVIEKEESIFIITEYCSKGDLLSNLIKNGTYTEEKSCKIFQQVLSSLEYLHKNNICHRDIKPENILLDEYGDAKLSDFGLSKKFEKSEFLKTPCGSPLYAAPERLTGKPYNGKKIDIWSLGISLYTMVCGELPFDVDDENDMKTLVYKITNGIYTIPDNVSSEFKDLISKILEINPDKRINIDCIKNIVGFVCLILII